MDCKMRRRPSSEEAESRADRGRSAVCGSRECWRIAFIAAKFCALFRCAKFKGNDNGTLTVTMALDGRAGGGKPCRIRWWSPISAAAEAFLLLDGHALASRDFAKNSKSLDPTK